GGFSSSATADKEPGRTPTVRPGPDPRDQRSNSPSLAPATNASHSAGVNTSTGPAGFLLSRTALRSPTHATSPQLSQFRPLRVLLRHTAPPRSIISPSPWVVRRGTVPRRQPAARPPAGPSPRAAP